jgi:transcriptional regulator with XRE-family HTH domain
VYRGTVEVVPRKLRRTKRAFNPQEIFGTVLRELRQQHGYSQDSFAHVAGYHRNYIGQLERGEKSPSLKALFDFADSLGLRPSQLLARLENLVGSRSKR